MMSSWSRRHRPGRLNSAGYEKRAPISLDELTIYREGIVALISADPLMWWKAHATEFTGLFRMSLDMLAISANTANVVMQPVF
jgi:hypothetical protein